MPKGQYSAQKTIEKGLKYLLFYGIPALLATAYNYYPVEVSVVVGTLVTMLNNYHKFHKA